ncbi:MAG: glycoside hydrolase family 172 protein [Luteitalea sp.]
MRRLVLAVAGLIVLAGPALDSQSSGSLLQGWLTLQPGTRSLRVSSFDRSGGNNDRLEGIPNGDRRMLADIKGPGQITHIWVTIAPPPPTVSRHDIILRMYWDDEQVPSVEAPIGEFFGQGWNESYPMAALPLAAGPREGRAMVSYFPMPFRSRARIEVENDTGRAIDAFYYYVDYEQLPALPAETPYFHAWYHHQLTEAQSYGENEWGVLGPEQKNATGADNFLVADIVGRGHYVGMNYYVHSPSTMWYGEGDDLFQVDGEPWPGSLHGTGTEDYFNTAWAPTQDYHAPYHGVTLPGGENWAEPVSLYRFHIEDPVTFERSVRVTIEHGHANKRSDDISSTAYWYQTEPHRPFDLLSAPERVPQRT